VNDRAHLSPAPAGPGAPHRFGPNLVLHQESYPLSLLARLGHPSTQQPEAGRLATRLFEYLFSQVASRELPVEVARVETRMTRLHPAQVYEGAVVRREQAVVVVDVARAGILGAQLFYDRFSELLDASRVRQDHVFMSRVVDASGSVKGSAIAGAKIGGPIEGAVLVVPDPMGATGGSLCELLDHYARIGAGAAARVVFAHLVVTPEYVRRVHGRFPEVRIHAVRLDRGFSTPAALAALPGELPDGERGLDDHQYVVPGAGGLGEVLNNSWV
jgi:uracil phosphoribosyltransferase